MMLGTGFSKWATQTTKQNRQLLKGGKGGGYQNFDKSYITDQIISRKPLVFKEATPEQLEIFRRRLKVIRKKEIIRKIKAMIISLVIVGMLVFWVFGQ
ncbi:MAG: hypothetical protein ABJF11_17600 [Reichenbachiella sp.]|uniref:hypothetical protein n=1 Tax=Reichenbachiella sp. TaxID=2184521 RepID=UPI003266D614